MWISGSTNIELLVWFKEWPQEIRNQLCSSSNPLGAIIISDMNFLALEAHLKQYRVNL